jgi:3-hydroxymyristoyl/3-hydroxydecanoyl-(acyl carrier protein) dehydratase
MLEAIALTVGIAASPRLKEGYIPLFRRMDRLDFLNPVKINDLVRTEAEVTCQSSRFIEGNGRAFVGDKLVAEAKRIICLIGRGSK